MYFLKYLNVMVILIGDFNLILIGLCFGFIVRFNYLRQFVKFNIRDLGILDWFFINRFYIFNFQRLFKFGVLDYYIVLVSLIVKYFF